MSQEFIELDPCTEDLYAPEELRNGLIKQMKNMNNPIYTKDL